VQKKIEKKSEEIMVHDIENGLHPEATKLTMMIKKKKYITAFV